jgi:hypothetical protein
MSYGAAERPPAYRAGSPQPLRAAQTATAASAAVIGISPNKAAARDSYQSDPAEAVSTSNHASSANKVAVTAATADVLGGRIRDNPDLYPEFRAEGLVAEVNGAYGDAARVPEPQSGRVGTAR